MRSRRKLILTLVVLLVIGFATVSTTLVLSGVIGISANNDDFKVIFTSAKLNNKKRNDFIDQDTKQTINFETNKLTTLDEEAILDYDVTNTSRLYDGEVVINCDVPDNDYIIVDYQPRSMTVEAANTKSGRITARLVKVTTEDDNISIKCTLSATAIERDELGEEYVEPFSKSGTMMMVPITSSSDKKYWAYKSNVTKIVFEDKMIEHETSSDLVFDVSDAQDGSVISYLVANGETLTTTKDADNKDLVDATAYTLYIQSDTGVVANSNSKSLFNGFNNLKSIENLEYFDTSQVTNMYGIFGRCMGLENLDLSKFDTSQVTNMAYMFYSCGSLTTLNVSNFDTSQVTDMQRMFNECKSLTALNVSNFDTSQVTDMQRMFSGCGSLTTLNLSNFDTSQVANMAYMFSGCGNLTTLNLSNFDTSQVTNMQSMFNSCDSLTTLDVSNFDTSQVTNMANMFHGCDILTILKLSSFDTSQVTNMASMFDCCGSLTTLDLSNFDTSQVTSMVNMFRNCNSLVTLNLSMFDTSQVTNMYAMFYGCNNLESLNVGGFDTSNVTNMYMMFYSCKKLTSLDLSSFNTSNVTDMHGLFNSCSNLIDLDIRRFDINETTNVGLMFSAMPSNAIIKVKDEAMQNRVLTNIDHPNTWTTNNVIVAS